MYPFEHPEFLQRFAVIVVLVVLTFRGLALFFQRVLGIPYPRWHEVVMYVSGVGLLTIVLPDWRAVLTMWLIAVAGSSLTMWQEGRARRSPPPDSTSKTNSKGS